MDTKAVQLTADEVRGMIDFHARNTYVSSDLDHTDEMNSYRIERMKYFDKRLKDFSTQEAPKSW